MDRPPPVTKDTECGIGFIRGSLLQKFANKKAYVFIYGVTGLIFSSSYAYFNGTITAMEKRFKIPSRTTGFITTGSDMSQLLTVVLSYYAGKGHRPRWIAMGVYTVVLYCLMNALPHFMYGAGEEALSLTEEWRQSTNLTSVAFNDRVCNKGEGSKCIEGGDLAPQIILFAAQFISGIGGSLYYTLGVTYMDDNIKKSKTPALVSLSYFIRMLGPAMGYTLASFCLSMYISPSLTPVITRADPRWLGAWWLGWIIVGGSLFLFSTLLGLFPKILPRAAQRKLMEQKEKENGEDEHKSHDMPSWDDLVRTVKKLLRNKTFMCNTLSSVFYFMGYMPYWIFMPKYIETNYKISAADSSFITGTFGLIFSALGVLISGMVISKMKPRARSLAMWNVFVGGFSVLIIISYAFMGCADDTQNPVVGLDLNATCRADCHCQFTKYAPVCGNGVTYISACHAGCISEKSFNGSTTFHDCACIDSGESGSGGGKATQGPCPVDCKAALIIFIIAMCATKFTGATGRTSNFLVSVRCVDEKDKSAAMGLGVLFMSAFAFIPSPILFGHLIDTTCRVWGQTCSGKGNCWLYDGAQLRTLLNFTSAVFVTIGTLLDLGVWYYVKNLPIFDEQVGDEEKDKTKECVGILEEKVEAAKNGKNQTVEAIREEEEEEEEPTETDKLTEQAVQKHDTRLIGNGI